MKRMKFLNGIGAMFALAGVAIATTFTSCEKEDFNVNVDPINAQATIEATVLYVDENSTTNVTDLAEINYSAGPTFTGNPTLSAQTVTVTAEYNGISGSATVNVPALGAGQFLSMSTTIILQEAAPAPVNAKAEVKPVVLLSADGVLKDITDEAEITFEPDNGGVFEGAPELESTTSLITAVYGELSNTIEVEIPALQAGQYATLAPTIILQQIAEEANAIAEIKPIVLHMTPSAVVDVTAEAKITFDPAGVFEGDPALKATTAKVTASYEGLESTVTVSVPALEAGEYTTLTPTIILMDAIEVPDVKVTIEYEPNTVQTEEATDKFVEDNVSDYWYYTSVTYTEKKGNQVASTEVNTQDLNEVNSINSFVAALNTYTETQKVQEEVPVYSHSRTEASVTYTVEETTYTIYRVTTTTMVPLTKAESSVEKEEIATIVTKNYVATQLNTTPGLQIPGHGHAPMGHGHGYDHGHGHGNSGGGIVVAD